MPTPSNLFMSWSGTQVTPAGGSAIPIPEVKSCDVERGGETKRWSADAATFTKAIAHRNKTRKFKIMGGALNKLALIPEDTPCTVVSILNDYHNGAGVGSGALQFTLVNAVLVSNPFKGSNNEFATGDVEFEAYSTDGTTDPLTTVVL